MARTKELNPKQLLFVQEYLIDRNGTQAAIRAGYSEKGAKVTAVRLLTNRTVSALVAKGRFKTQSRLEVTAERTLLEVARLAFSDPRKLYDENGRIKPPGDWDDDTAAAISSIEFSTALVKDEDGTERTETVVSKVKVWDKNPALEKLMKFFGMLVDKKEVSGPGGQPIDIRLSGTLREITPERREALRQLLLEGIIEGEVVKVDEG